MVRGDEEGKGLRRKKGKEKGEGRGGGVNQTETTLSPTEGGKEVMRSLSSVFVVYFFRASYLFPLSGLSSPSLVRPNHHTGRE